MDENKTYAIKEVYFSIQGEGAYSGCPVVFVRYAGCNVWTGREEDRKRNVEKGRCALWCDTDFVGTDGPLGGKYTASELAHTIRKLWPNNSEATAVMTGGEPSLQIDTELVKQMTRHAIRVHVETNGSNELPKEVAWVTLSPKPPMPFVPQRYDELKVVCPEFDPLELNTQVETLCGPEHISHKYIQPQWDVDPRISSDNTAQCIEFLKNNTDWRLSVQTHKFIGLP